MDNRELQTMILCKLGQWLEITHAWLFQNQMKNFCLLEQDLVISAHIRLKIKCLFLLKVYVHKVSKVYKLLLMIKLQLEVEMAKLFYSM